ncbi:hypothetical protein RhiirA4_445320 [Rhizophagus irregularis]|uniref:G-protein coupled receptors family 1 profile domain-containing protein n=1 Tax=Rhizophagus irregularis TaxID=588596 RepID=A0A2I1GPC0_9GLOM|nr:hypothetical protein RhiirA4_445320 [Rhizophagus irregularis]
MINRSNNKFFIKYPYIPIITLLFNVRDVIADHEYLNTPSNKVNFRSVVDLSLTMLALGFIGCFYVFYRIYKQWILNKKSLVMIHKLPYYTACIDMLLNANFLVNIMHTAIRGRVWDDPVCQLMSVFNWAFISINLCFYCVIAITTYLRICHEKYFDYGRYDYKLWLIVLITSTILQIINIPNHGGRKYWCAGKPGQVRSPMILFVMITSSLLIVCFCYMNILVRIINIQNPSISALSKDSANENGIGNDVLEQRAEIERRAAKKILSYVVIFIMQWVPVQISAAARFFLNDHTWVYLVTSIGRSFGGIGNAIQYVLNEGWVTRESTEYDTTKSQETDNKSTSLNNDNYKLLELNNNNNNNNNNNKKNNNISPKNTENTGITGPIINIEGSNQGYQG